MFKIPFWRRLSGKLLVLTILFVMAAEVLIFIPSAAMYRQSWLVERAEAAGLLTLAIEGVPNYQGSEMLSKQFMQDTNVSMVAQIRGDTQQIVLGAPINEKIVSTDDLRVKKQTLFIGKTLRALWGNGEGTIRVLTDPTVSGVDVLELCVPQAALKTALAAYCNRVLLWSLIISLITGLFIYFVLARVIVAPLHNLGAGLAAFRADPRKRLPKTKPSMRADEIGDLEREFITMKNGVRLALTRQEHLATLGMAMAKINHDLRNVLTSTQLISDRLAADQDPNIAHMGERLVKTVDRGVALCEATLSFSKSVEERPKLQSVPMAELADEAAHASVNGDSSMTFQNKIPKPCRVHADPNQTYRILHNLFRNAVQAMQTSTIKTLSVTATPATHPDGKIQIRIQDTGPGLPQPVIDNLFKAFTSGEQKGGTGLGLTIARELARGQGGNLILESSSADGTVFLLSLPSHR